MCILIKKKKNILNWFQKLRIEWSNVFFLKEKKKKKKKKKIKKKKKKKKKKKI